MKRDRFRAFVTGLKSNLSQKNALPVSTVTGVTGVTGFFTRSYERKNIRTRARKSQTKKFKVVVTPVTPVTTLSWRRFFGDRFTRQRVTDLTQPVTEARSCR